MTIGWYMRRLRRMSAQEVVRRSRDELVKRRWRRRHARPAPRDAFALPRDLPPWRATLRSLDLASLPAEAKALLERAAANTLGGTWPVFDRVRTDMAGVPDWFFDPLTTKTAPQRVYAFDVDHRRAQEVGNAKYVWEVSRHHHLTVLAAAYFASGDARYAECVDRHLRSWWAENPFLSGVHWTSGIELGIRLIAWVWVRRLLDGWAGARDLFEGNAVFLRQLHDHQEFIATLRSHGSSANNHLLTEAAGQFAACCAFPYFAESARWQRDAAAVLTREIENQTFPCGLNRELATDYHGFVLELCLAAALEGEAAGESLGATAWCTIRRMMDALAAMVDVKCRPPRQGDGDDGLGLLLDAPGFDRWASLLSTGEALFGGCAWWPDFPRADLRSVFWAHLARAPELSAARPAARSSLFEGAGMALLRDLPGSSSEIWCRCDHGPHGYLSIAAHAHADALSLEVRHDGVDVLADPGTYLYHGAPEWRAYFRSTLAHNTLQLCDVDQSIAGGDFLWMRHASADLIGVDGLDEGPTALWDAGHDGYARLSSPARHERVVRLDRARRRLLIVDRVKGEGEWPCRLAFHLGPSVTCRLSGCTAELGWRDEKAHRRARLILPARLAWTAVTGQASPPLGWYSPAFGKKLPSTTLIGSGTVTPSIFLATELLFAEQR